MERYRQLDFDAVGRLKEAFFKKNDGTPELRRIVVPEMVVVGELDTLKPLDPYTHFLATELRGAQLLLLVGAGHACCLETPAAWNAAVLRWLATHSDSPP